MKVVYPDTSILPRLMGEEQPAASTLLQAVERREVKLAISFVHLVETLKKDDDDLFKRRIQFFSRLDREDHVVWCASQFLLLTREVTHFAGTQTFPEDSRLAVETMGQTLAYRIGRSLPSSELALTPAQFEREWYSESDVDLNATFRRLNDKLDQYADKLRVSRALFERGDAPVSFVDWFTATIPRVVEVPTQANRLHELPIEVQKTKLPALWTWYALELEIIRRRKSFALSDVRDLMHAAYAPYVDVLIADSSTYARSQEADLPSSTKASFMSVSQSIDVESWI